MRDRHIILAFLASGACGLGTGCSHETEPPRPGETAYIEDVLPWSTHVCFPKRQRDARSDEPVYASVAGPPAEDAAHPATRASADTAVPAPTTRPAAANDCDCAPDIAQP